MLEDWKAGGSVLSSGDKNGVVLLHDLRSKQVANKLEFHKDDVCGLKWDKSGQFLASGSEDTTVLIWDWRTLLKPLIVFTEHRAAVKAIDWCSWKSGLIATGSGRMDGSIKTWSIYQGRHCYHYYYYYEDGLNLSYQSFCYHILLIWLE